MPNDDTQKVPPTDITFLPAQIEKICAGTYSCGRCDKLHDMMYMDVLMNENGTLVKKTIGLTIEHAHETYKQMRALFVSRARPRN